jgi:hypothetical protein
MLNKKKIKRFFNLIIPSMKAVFENQAIGPILSPYISKDKINNFCTEFNTVSIIYKYSLLLHIKLILFVDNSFFFIIKGPTLSLLFKLVYNIDSCFQLKDFDINVFDFFDLVFVKDFFFLNQVKTSYVFSFFFKKRLLMSINSFINLIISEEGEVSGNDNIII